MLHVMYLGHYIFRIALLGKYSAFIRLHNGHGHLFAVLTVKLKVVYPIVVVTVSKIVIKNIWR